MAMEKTKLIKKIVDFQNRHKISDYALGMAAAGDGHLIRRLRNGIIKDPKISTVQKILKVMSERDGAEDRNADSKPKRKTRRAMKDYA